MQTCGLEQSGCVSDYRGERTEQGKLPFSLDFPFSSTESWPEAAQLSADIGEAVCYLCRAGKE